MTRSGPSGFLATPAGTFCHGIEIGGVHRRVLAYVPDGARASTSGVVVVPDSGVTIEQAMAESGWVEIADGERHREKLIVFFCEASERWSPEEPADDLAYLGAVARFVESRFWFCVHESKRSIAGYGEGAVIAKMAALTDPAFYASVVAVNASPLPDGFRERTEVADCENLQGFVNGGRFPIAKGQIGLPVWLIDDGQPGSDDELAAWQRRNRCGVEGSGIDGSTTEFTRCAPVSHPMDEEPGAFRVRRSRIPGAGAQAGSVVNARLWSEFLSRHRRWMSLPGGDLRRTADPVEGLGMEHHLEEIDGVTREWYVHVPVRVRTSGHPAAVVVAMHGYTCSGEVYVGNSGWAQVADEFGFIVVFPTAMPGRLDVGVPELDPNFTPLPAWNIVGAAGADVDDLAFIDAVLARTARDWLVDPARIYATGHSWGSVMTHSLAACRPERFAAVAPCSGVFFGNMLEPVRDKAVEAPRPVPVWMLWGSEEEWLISPRPDDGTQAAATIRFWAERNGVEVPENLSAALENVHIDAAARTWRQAEFIRAGVPVVRYTIVDGLPHATMPSMSRRIWTDFFAGIRKGDGPAMT